MEKHEYISLTDIIFQALKEARKEKDLEIIRTDLSSISTWFAVNELLTRKQVEKQIIDRIKEIPEDVNYCSLYESMLSIQNQDAPKDEYKSVIEEFEDDQSAVFHYLLMNEMIEHSDVTDICEFIYGDSYTMKYHE